MQIGNAITEKMVLDVVLQARDRGLFRSITDCGAGGLQLGRRRDGRAELGAVVDLDRAPLKYEGLSYTEIWISEAQERMVLAVPPEQWPELQGALRRARRSRRPTSASSSTPAGSTLRYHGEVVGDLSMDFLHEGRPAVVRTATFTPPARAARRAPRSRTTTRADLLAILGHVGRLQQGVDRPPVRPRGPGADGRQAAGRRRTTTGRATPRSSCRCAARRRGLAVACGINPRYGRLDPYAMAGCVIDEAVRNCVAVGADPDRIALLDNFCWGNTERPETLGSLVLAAQGVPRPGARLRHAVHLGQGQPEQRIHARRPEPGDPADAPDQRDGPGARRPPVRDDGPEGAGQPRSSWSGMTRLELGGSHWADRPGPARGAASPGSIPTLGRALFRAVHAAISGGLVRSCHDLSEGGLAVALAEMAIAGGLGAERLAPRRPLRRRRRRTTPSCSSPNRPRGSSSKSAPSTSDALADLFGGLPLGRLGEVAERPTAAARLA